MWADSEDVMPALILIVEDESNVRELLSEIVRHYGFRVLVATDGVQAISTAQNEHPALVILDILMPGMDGIDVCRTLKQGRSTSNSKVIMLTALNDEATRERALEAGADGYMAKPFTGPDLLNMIEDVLVSTT